MATLSRSARYYRRNKKARDKKKAYDKKYNATDAHKKKRAGDNRARRRLGLKKGDPRDASRTKNGFVAEHKSKNRGRQGANGRSTLK